MTFFRRRVVPATPPSLVKFSRRASAVTTGASSSVPTRDHVPELRNAVPSRAEMAATADPVSWVAGAITGVPERADEPEMLGKSFPIGQPGSTIGLERCERRQRRAMRAGAAAHLLRSR